MNHRVHFILALSLLLASQPCLADTDNNLPKRHTQEYHTHNLRKLGLEAYFSTTVAPATTGHVNVTFPQEDTRDDETSTDAPSVAQTSELTQEETPLLEDTFTDKPQKEQTLQVVPKTVEPTVAPVAPTTAPVAGAPPEVSEKPEKTPVDEPSVDDGVPVKDEDGMSVKEQDEEEVLLEDTITDETETQEQKEPPTATPNEQVSEVDNNESINNTDEVNFVPQGDLYSETRQYNGSLGEVFVEFSLWSPTRDSMELDFLRIKTAVIDSFDVFVCDASDPIREQGPGYCAVRDKVLLKDSSSIAMDSLVSSASDSAVVAPTMMVLTSTNVNDGNGVVHNSELLIWTTWRVSWGVLQIGSALRNYIEDMYVIEGTTFSEAEKNLKELALLQQIISVETERNIRRGVFQADLNMFLADEAYEVKSSVVGEEVNTFGAMMHPAIIGNGNHADEEGDGNDMMIILFFSGLAVAVCVIATLLYFSCRSRRYNGGQGSKRNIIIVDDTSKTDSDPNSHRSSPVKGPPPMHTYQVDEEEEADEEQLQHSFVIDHEQALQNEPPQQEFHQSLQMEQEDEEVPVTEGDAHTHARSMATNTLAESSMYTSGSGISAITGVSGLENSDTWSVGSMSIDLADWG